MGARFVPDRAGRAAMLRSPQMVAALHRTGERIRNFARFSSPYRTGRYSRSWRIYSGVRNGVAWCRVANVVFYSYFVEWGTKRMRRQRVLGRAITAAKRR